MRRALIPVSPELIGEMCRNGETHYRTESGLPEDAKFIGARYDDSFRWFLVCFESDEFADIPEGKRLPELKPVLHTLTG